MKTTARAKPVFDTQSFDASDVGHMPPRTPMAHMTVTKLVTETTELPLGDGPGLTFGQILDLELANIAKGDGIAHEMTLDIDQEMWAAVSHRYKEMDYERVESGDAYITSRPTKAY